MIQNHLPLPRNDVAFVLHSLLNRPFISERDFNLNGFRSRLSNIRSAGVEIQFERVPFVNDFGRNSMYKQHFLLPEHQDKAIEVYYKINNCDPVKKPVVVS